MKLIIILASFIISQTCVSALKCYVCTLSASDTSDTCIFDPAAVTSGSPTVECSKKYCTIVRQEYKNPSGRVASFYRNCESNPVYLNHMVEDTDFKTYYRACTADLCNIGNGITSVTGGNSGSGGGNLMVPGIGGSNSANIKSFNCTIILFFLFAIYQNIN